MLKTVISLKGKKKLQEVYSFGKKFYTENISSIIVYDFESISFPMELAVTVRKKINRKAVTRNRIKRLMRESLRLCIKEIPEQDESNGSFFIKYIVLYWRHQIDEPRRLKLGKVKSEVAAILEKASNYSKRYQKERLVEDHSADNNQTL